jgi:spermidine synthase
MNSAVYLLFFLSGAAALIYEVLWLRALGLVFGGSHLAVTAVLSVYMAGLASGGYFIGKYVDKLKKPLRFYGLLELGISATALLSFLLIKFYPVPYVFFATGKDNSFVYLSTIRVLFALFALIGPTFLMGGTLPALSRFVSKGKLLSSLSFLYGINTLGAVLGTLAAGFVFLPRIPVSSTLIIALFLSTGAGVASILLQKKFGPSEEASLETPLEENLLESSPSSKADYTLQYKLLLWGIGISGFCALGYEVLWTRVLAIVIGATVYGFTTMLAAFLTGIALGSKSVGLLKRLFPKRMANIPDLVFSFGAIQIAIGVLALLVTVELRRVPADALGIYKFFEGMNLDIFAARQWSNLGVSFLYMLAPAFFMGAAFPIAGAVQAEYRRKIGSAVGEVLAFNTVGAILGAALSGFLLIYLFGTERSLEILCLLNAGLGVIVILSLKRSRLLLAAATGGVAVLIIFLIVSPGFFRIWNPKFFAVFESNRPEAFRTPELLQEALETTDVLYYHEGAEATVAAIRRKWGEQSFLINGRVEASTNPADNQVQYTLGHLPMLLARDPRRVLVIGLGSGMTAGATSVHPAAEKVTLVELEPGMPGVARTFAAYNHNIIESPKLEILLNDGRNYLLTTKEKFDVITADPIHPWFRGSGYLYTKEYFDLAAKHLTEGGVICQWLPIYELSLKDLQSIIKTFQQSFKHTLLWITYWDSVIIGSNSPFVLDPAELERRISVPAVKADLAPLAMGSARDFLSYFIMGTSGMTAFAEEGTINTDNNLYLEFSAPLSMGRHFLTGRNAATLAQYRESILPYLALSKEEDTNGADKMKYLALDGAGKYYDRAHALFLSETPEAPELSSLLKYLDQNYPGYGPARFLKSVYKQDMERAPALVWSMDLPAFDENGRLVMIKLIALKTKMGPDAAFLDFAEPERRIHFGRALFFQGKDVDMQVALAASRKMEEIRMAYGPGTSLKKTVDFIASVVNKSE